MKKVKKEKEAKMGETSGRSDRSFLHQFFPELAEPLNGECPVQERR